LRAFIIAISQPPTKMRGLIILTRQDEENTIDVFFLYKRAREVLGQMEHNIRCHL
jgi:hypothetical protein